MMEWTVCGVHIRVSIWFPVMLIVLLSWDTTGVTLLGLSAAMLHELGHCTAMWRYRDIPSSITVGIFGIRAERRSTQTVGYAALCRIALAGPLANVFWCAVTAAAGWHNAALVHAVCGGLHLLPVLSLDGGEALYAQLCTRMTEERAEQLLYICSAIALFPLSALGVCIWMADGYNVTLLVLCGYLILRMFLHRGH